MKSRLSAQKCRFCGKPLVYNFLSLGSTPPSNSYLTKEELQRAEVNYPLDLYVCDNCFLVQLPEVVRSQEIFSSQYAYFSSYSKIWLDHCSRYAEKMIEEYKLGADSFVMEIASNDGCLLKNFVQKNIPVLGVEPAASAAKLAIEKEVPTDIEFFSSGYAEKLAAQGKRADLIAANNVLAHTPHLNDFVKGMKIALKPGGIITVEFPHLLKLFKFNQFDTIYHEHYSYFSLFAVSKVFLAQGLEVFDVEELPTHGGSLRLYVKHKEDNSKRVSLIVNEIIEQEKKMGLFDIPTYLDFGKRVNFIKRSLLSLLIKIKEDQKTIVGYGAPAKGNTLLNYCGIRNDFLEYTVDKNPFKQDKFLPGTHIAIRNPECIAFDKPDYILILPWNLEKEIREQLAFVKGWNCKFVIPIPEVVVV